MIEIIGCGVGRIVFGLSDDYVLKIPYNDNGKKQSALEWERWQKNEWKGLVAQIYNYHAETGIMVMERLHECKSVHYRDQLPEHKCFFEKLKQSGIQIGIDKRGFLKLYDYGDFVLGG